MVELTADAWDLVSADLSCLYFVVDAPPAYVGGSSVPRRQLHSGAGRPIAQGSSDIVLTLPFRIN